MRNRLSLQQQKPQKHQHHHNHRQNKFYKDFAKRKDVIEQFSMKLCEFICALSTVHSNVSQKISIMFALFQKQSNHLYFLDFQSSIESSLLSSMNDCSIIDSDDLPTVTNHHKNQPNEKGNQSSSNNNLVPYRSMSVMSILRKVFYCCFFLKSLLIFFQKNICSFVIICKWALIPIWYNWKMHPNNILN